ncbi:MAG: hypothetical protein Q9209_003372 [Squamulea sp. 1 TL-2023]
MADALCGPSNSLQNFQKHASVDRTLQQDRLRSRQSPLQGFRTPNPNAGILDAEFEAFIAGEPVYSEPYRQLDAWQNHLPLPQQPAFPPSQATDWASDFQNLHVHDAGPSPLPLSQLRTEAPLQRASSGPWQQDFLQQHKVSSSNHHPSSSIVSYPSYTPSTLSIGNPSLYENQYGAPVLGQQTEAEVQESFDEEAFEKAFDAAKVEFQGQEASLHQDKTVNQPPPKQTTQGLDDRVDYRIGSDRILDEALRLKEASSKEQDADELARTAGQLLDNVKHDQSSKFRKSNFFSLMRQLRDKEAKLEGDNFVDVEQPLHPGGPGYPKDIPNTEMMETTDAFDMKYGDFGSNQNLDGYDFDAFLKEIENPDPDQSFLKDGAGPVGGSR